MHSNGTTDQAERFLELLVPLQRELEVYCRRLIWDREQIQDALQSAVMHAVSSFDCYHEGTNFRAWMYKILTHEVLAFNRRHQRLASREYQLEPEDLAELAVAEDTSPAPALEWQEGMDENLVHALETLTDLERATLLQRALAGFKYQEISESLGVPIGSVMGYLARARQKMRLALRRSPSNPFR